MVMLTVPRARDARPYQDLGAAVRAARKAAHLSQRALAERANLSDGYPYQIESGQTRPEPETLRQLARALNVPYEQLAVPAGYMRSSEVDVEDPEFELLFREVRTTDLTPEARESIKEFLRFSLERHWAKHPESKIGRQ